MSTDITPHTTSPTHTWSLGCKKRRLQNRAAPAMIPHDEYEKYSPQTVVCCELFFSSIVTLPSRQNGHFSFEQLFSGQEEPLKQKSCAIQSGTVSSSRSRSPRHGDQRKRSKRPHATHRKQPAIGPETSKRTVNENSSVKQMGPFSCHFKLHRSLSRIGHFVAVLGDRFLPISLVSEENTPRLIFYYFPVHLLVVHTLHRLLFFVPVHELSNILSFLRQVAVHKLLLHGTVDLYFVHGR